MDPFTTVTSVPTPLLRDDVDTDLIIPAAYLKTVSRSGLGEGLFRTLRYDESGAERPDSIFRAPRYRGSQILLAGKNFGCGSSREHAVWALLDYGYRVIVAESFADIFASNAVKNGVLALALEGGEIAALAAEGEAGRPITVDLENQDIRTGDERRFGFAIEAFSKRCLLEGLDEVARTLSDHGEAIAAFESQQSARQPWLYRGVGRRG